MPFVADNQATEVLQPGKEPLDLPAALVSSEHASILRLGLRAVCPVRRDQIGSELGQDAYIERVTVVGSVADQPDGRFFNEAVVEHLFDERDLMRASTGDAKGDRKTRAVCNGHDLGPFAALGFPDVEPFFLALAKEPSMKVSLRSKPPRA